MDSKNQTQERVIKFRGWDIKNRKWIYGSLIEKIKPTEVERVFWGYLIHDGALSAELVAKESVGQFTGLRDKNGVEIYEGDILRHEDASYPLTVKYAGAGFVAGYAIKDAALEYDLHLVNADYEVIGNLMENPELLTP